jgi:hypothetical protein
MVLFACQNIAFGKFGCVDQLVVANWLFGYFLTTFYLGMSGGMTGSVMNVCTSPSGTTEQLFWWPVLMQGMYFYPLF